MITTTPQNDSIRTNNLIKIKKIARKLSRFSGEKLDKAICDIIDARGFALPFLLKYLPKYPPPVRKHISGRIEDVLFFHPQRGKRAFPRLLSALDNAGEDCVPHLLAAVADVFSKHRKSLRLPQSLSGIAYSVLKSDVDLIRKSKAVEILSEVGAIYSIPDIIEVLKKSLNTIDTYESFHFTETVLFALKRMGGEGLLRLMINPQSQRASKQFRLEWRNNPQTEMKRVLAVIDGLDEGFAQIILKVIDLAEFSIPFTSMVTEGLQHTDKWVRQVATAALSKIVNKKGFKHLKRMLKDPSMEVRMMAVSSLGSFSPSKSGGILHEIAKNESESIDCRMNALYALFSQKNKDALEALFDSPTEKISINAKGLSCLLMPKDKGLPALLELVIKTPANLMQEYFHYLMELAVPEDLELLVKTHALFANETQRKCFLEFLAMFMQNKAGKALDEAISRLAPRERTAVESLRKANNSTSTT